MKSGYQIFFWRYDRPSSGYRGFHLSADKNGCDLFIEKIHDKLQTPSERTAKFSLQSLSEQVLSVPNCPKPAKTWNVLEVIVDHSSPRGKLNISIKNDTANITTSTDMAEQLVTGIEDIRSGEGDYAISDALDKDDKNKIWFWWLPNK